MVNQPIHPFIAPFTITPTLPQTSQSSNPNLTARQFKIQERRYLGPLRWKKFRWEISKHFDDGWVGVTYGEWYWRWAKCRQELMKEWEKEG